MPTKVIITGGGGFIGTHVAYALDLAGYDITIVDRKFKHKNLPGALIEQDYLDFFRENTIKYDLVVHLAADHEVEQSVSYPSKFYENNAIRMKSFLDCLVASGIKNIVFSSSASVYGRQGALGPLNEDMMYDAVNAYAATKIVGELLIRDYARAYGLNYVIFRYFNAAGADPQGRAGYVQRPATHVVPILCNRALKNQSFKLYGTDYDTRDGTCIRDYIHVSDIASAHVSAIEHLLSTSGSNIFNVGGNIEGTSIKELLKSFSSVTGIRPVVEYAERRAGDPASLTADTKKIQSILGWQPKYSVEDIILHAWEWEKRYEKFI